MRLINWPWLEDLLVTACEAEVRDFAGRHPEKPFFAFALEFDGLAGTLDLSYGCHASVEEAVAGLHAAGEPLSYREVELRPEFWRHHRAPRRDSEGAWERAEPILQAYRETITADPEGDQMEFLWLRFEYLAECVVQRMLDRGSFRHLTREREFIAFSSNEEETLEELEERLARLFPGYRRATAEFSPRPRRGELPPGRCEQVSCRAVVARRRVARCTYCQRWYCEACQQIHSHPELAVRTPLLLAE